MLNRSATSRCQQTFSKLCLVNLISKDTHLVFSIYTIRYCLECICLLGIDMIERWVVDSGVTSQVLIIKPLSFKCVNIVCSLPQNCQVTIEFLQTHHQQEDNTEVESICITSSTLRWWSNDKTGVFLLFCVGVNKFCFCLFAFTVNNIHVRNLRFIIVNYNYVSQTQISARILSSYSNRSRSILGRLG